MFKLKTLNNISVILSIAVWVRQFVIARFGQQGKGFFVEVN